MAFLPTSANAREQSQGNAVVAGEIAILTQRVLSAISSGVFTITATSSTTVTINGTTITGSVMTNADVTGQAYYTAWQGTTTDAVKTEQMAEVISHFQKLGYAIVRKSTTGTEHYWQITW